MKAQNSELNINDCYIVPVIQYLLPHGRKRNCKCKLPNRTKSLYKEMKKAGCRFEAEILCNGLVSVTIFDPSKEEDIDISITRNGPEVIHGMIAMLKRKSWNEN